MSLHRASDSGLAAQRARRRMQQVPLLSTAAVPNPPMFGRQPSVRTARLTYHCIVPRGVWISHPASRPHSITIMDAARRTAAGGGSGGGGQATLLRLPSRNRSPASDCMISTALIVGPGPTCSAPAGSPIARPARVRLPGCSGLAPQTHKFCAASSRRAPIAAGSPAATLAPTAAAAAAADPAMLLLAVAGAAAAWAAWTLLRFAR